MSPKIMVKININLDKNHQISKNISGIILRYLNTFRIILVL